MSIGPYIVDFYCPECRLAIELDGAAHFRVTMAERDAQRTEYLRERGIKIIRFENRSVYKDLEIVLEEIKKNLNDHPVCAFGAAPPPL